LLRVARAISGPSSPPSFTPPAACTFGQGAIGRCTSISEAARQLVVRSRSCARATSARRSVPIGAAPSTAQRATSCTSPVMRTPCASSEPRASSTDDMLLSSGRRAASSVAPAAAPPTCVARFSEADRSRCHVLPISSCERRRRSRRPFSAKSPARTASTSPWPSDPRTRSRTRRAGRRSSRCSRRWERRRRFSRSRSAPWSPRRVRVRIGSPMPTMPISCERAARRDASSRPSNGCEPKIAWRGSPARFARQPRSDSGIRRTLSASSPPGRILQPRRPLSIAGSADSRSSRTVSDYGVVRLASRGPASRSRRRG
jgi:hypothetical protein